MSRFKPVDLLRPAIRKLTPFSSARGESAELASRSDWAWLDANESPWPPYGDFAAKCKANRYAEPQPKAVRKQLADLYGVSAPHLLLYRGSEEAPDFLIRCFCQPEREGVVISTPTFGVYSVSAAINDSPVRDVPLRASHGYDLDVEAILKGWKPGEKLVFVTSPNAPMGHAMPDAQIEALLKGLEGRAMVVVDQAYLEFSQAKDWSKELDAYPNLIVLRTVSKAYGLAGIRLGALIGDPEVLGKLQGVMPPYPISCATIEIVKEALSEEGLKLAAQRRDILVRERERLVGLLEKAPTVRRVFPSAANFLLVQTDDAPTFLKRCQKAGVIVRNRHNDLPNTVRITIGAPEENDRLLAALGVANDRSGT